MIGVVPSILLGLLISTGIYFLFLALLTIPAFQLQAIYLNSFTLTGTTDLNTPEKYGFLPGQVTPFHLRTPDNHTLYAWHILPPLLYARHAATLQSQPPGLAPDILTTPTFNLLTTDPSALLVLYFHGAAGTVASGQRPASYRAMSALFPGRIHILAIDYRGFGLSAGSPSEAGLIADALTLVDFALREARVPPERIVLFGQSLGTAVATGVMLELARRAEPARLKGAVLIAPFRSVRSLTETYSIAGVVPILSPLARVPVLLRFFHRFIWETWDTEGALRELVRIWEGSGEGDKYQISILHAQDDWDVPSHHGEALFWAAVDSTLDGEEQVSTEELRVVTPRSNSKEAKGLERRDFRDGSWIEGQDPRAGHIALHRETDKGIIRLETPKHGLHDMIMGYPVVSLAIWRAFDVKGLEDSA